jgi:hypothetical protein
LIRTKVEDLPVTKSSSNKFAALNWRHGATSQFRFAVHAGWSRAPLLIGGD